MSKEVAGSRGMSVNSSRGRDVTSSRVATAASKVLHNPKSSKTAKTTAGFALTQRSRNYGTSKK